MRVIKIEKFYRNNDVIHHLIVHGDSFGKEDVDYIVEDWCEKEGGGLNYGYRCKWEFVSDPELISSTIKKELKKLEDEMREISKKRSELWNYLYEITPEKDNIK